MIRKNILVTGRPGCGKTTLVKKVTGELRVTARGFFTEEIREGGSRVGFVVKTFGSGEGILAHIDYRGGHMVGKYGVDVVSFENLVLPELEEAISSGGLIVIDEIGRMELFSRKFQDAVVRALDAENPFLGVIKERGNGFVNGIKDRADVRLFTLTRENRRTLTREVMTAIRELPG